MALPKMKLSVEEVIINTLFLASREGLLITAIEIPEEQRAALQLEYGPLLRLAEDGSSVLVYGPAAVCKVSGR